MSNFTKPEFRFQRVMSDGSQEEPQVLELHDIKYDWKMGRRGFLLTGGLVGAVLAAGCSMPAITYLPQDKQKKEINSCEGISAHRADSRIKVAFTPDGKKMISRNGDYEEKEIKVWEFPSGRLLEKMKAYGHFIQSPTGKYIAVNEDSWKRKILVYTPDGESVAQINNKLEIDAMVFSSDGKILATVSNSKLINIWSIPSGELLHQLKPGGPFLGQNLAFLPTNNTLVSRTEKDFVFWNAETGEITDRKICECKLKKMIVSADGKWLIGKSDSGVLYVFNIANSRIEYEFKIDDNYALSKNGRFLAFCTPDGYFCVADLATGEETFRVNVNVEKKKYWSSYSFAISNDGTLAAYIVGEKEARVWDTSTAELKQIFSSESDRFYNIYFSPDDRYFVITNYENIMIGDMKYGQIIACLFDKETVKEDHEVTQYKATDQYGQVIVCTLPCGSPLPPGAICTCNCVAGTYVRPEDKEKKKKPRRGGSYRYCSCNKICTCVPVK